VLASRSPQRRAILARLGVAFEVRPADVEELGEGDPQEVVVENALRKARAVVEADAPPALVLGVDTVVTFAGRVYGKPRDEGHARETLQALSGSMHTVLSGVALIEDGQERTALASTQVVFRTLDEGLIDWYVALGEWRNRAGGYGIQGAGAALVREVRGDYENVVGFPLAMLLDLCPELLKT